jgi:hypothetical protein
MKSLALIERGAAGHREHRKCFTCHGQARPVVGRNTFVVVEADGDDLVHLQGRCFGWNRVV